MALKSGQSIENCQTGESLTMLVEEQESRGEFQLYRVHLPPHRPSPPLHYHLDFTETFSVQEGKLDIYLGKTRTHLQLSAGESVTAEARQLHTFANNTDMACVMTVETRPAGGVVQAFQLAYAVANDGGAAPDGLPRNLLFRLRFVQIAQGFLPWPPLPLQRVVLGIALLFARAAGIERQIQRYIADPL